MRADGRIDGTREYAAEADPCNRLDGGSLAESTLIRRRLFTRAQPLSSSLPMPTLANGSASGYTSRYGCMRGLGHGANPEPMPSVEDSSEGGASYAVVLSGARVGEWQPASEAAVVAASLGEGEARRLMPGLAVGVSETEAEAPRCAISRTEAAAEGAYRIQIENFGIYHPRSAPTMSTVDPDVVVHGGHLRDLSEAEGAHRVQIQFFGIYYPAVNAADDEHRRRRGSGARCGYTRPQGTHLHRN
ncbi:hypothetical protein C8F04DRAFT_1187361 [Mycena alexandri]|uniref:Uncharacterized protein n=1 Tax=Mycena alexandri TaxID=1745969 RepID=A0AAD6SLV8_9AGAR|nr:hypothetical protein C8F04DRAFT_1187361 [Mycena alexandri]